MDVPVGSSVPVERSYRWSDYIKKGCPSGGKVGKMCQRALEKTKAWKTGDVAVRRKLRQEYANGKYKEEVVGKEHSATIEQINRKKGVYKLPFKILLDQGGPKDPEAVQGAKNIIMQCMLLGPPFVKKHWQSKRWMFMEIEESQEDFFRHPPPNSQWRG